VPTDRRADRITVDGKTLRFTDVEFFSLVSSPANAARFVNGTNGFLVSVGVRAFQNAFFNAAAGLRAGQAWTKAGSGVRSASEAGVYTDAAYQTGLNSRDAFVLVDNGENIAYEPSLVNGGTGQGLGNAPAAIHADARVSIRPSFGGTAINLRYVQCPQTPFLNSAQQNVCDEK